MRRLCARRGGDRGPGREQRERRLGGSVVCVGGPLGSPGSKPASPVGEGLLGHRGRGPAGLLLWGGAPSRRGRSGRLFSGARRLFRRQGESGAPRRLQCSASASDDAGVHPVVAPPPPHGILCLRICLLAHLHW